MAEQSKNYRYSTNHQVVIDADPRLVVAVGRPVPGNRDDSKAWAESGAKDLAGGAAAIADGGYLLNGRLTPFVDHGPMAWTEASWQPASRTRLAGRSRDQTRSGGQVRGRVVRRQPDRRHERSDAERGSAAVPGSVFGGGLLAAEMRSVPPGDRLRVVSPPAFVGREREFAGLAEALACPPAVVLVEGEAGIGKSRLVREFLASPGIAPRGAWVAGACPPFREPYTLGPLVDALRQATDSVAGLGLSDLAGALRPLFPEWTGELPAAPEPAEDARSARYRLFRALTELLGCLGVSVLVVEDAHWADDATLEFLLFLASRQPPPQSLVVTYRPEDVPGDSLLLRLSSLMPAGTTRARVVLGPLDVADTATMVSSMLDGGRVSPRFAEFLHEHTDGVPLAVEESVRLMRDRADLAPHGSGWVRRRLAAIAVPPTVRDAVLERGRRLSVDAQAVLRAAAVLDDPAGEALLVAVSGLTADSAVAGLADALDSGLVEEDGRGWVSFRHGLAARAVYEAIPGPQRRLMHLRAGRALEEASPVPVARLARHFREASEAEAWIRYAEQAADAATAAGDWGGAVTMLHDLLSSVDLPPAEVAPLAAKIPHGAVTGTSGAHDVVASLRFALRSGRLDAEQEASTRYQLALLLDLTDDYDGARREMELAIPHLPPGSIQLVDAMLLLGWPRGSTYPGSEHRHWLRRARDASRALPRAEQPDVGTKIAVALLQFGESEGWEVAPPLLPEEMPTPAQRRNVTHRNLNLGNMAILWGRHAEARSHLGNALRLAEKYGHSRYREICLVYLVALDWVCGVWDGLAERAARIAESDDSLPMTRLQAWQVGAMLLGAEGRYAEAEAALERVVVEMHDLGAPEWMVGAAGALARLYLAADRPEDALRVTEESTQVLLFKETWMWGTDLMPARIEALVATGRFEDAAELTAAFASGTGGVDAPASQAAVVVCEGILAAGHGEHARAAAAFARAAAGWDAMPRPYDALLMRERQARCLIDAGSDGEAVELLTRVCHDMTELGARGDAQRIRDDLTERGVDVGGRRGRGRPGYGDRLSPRELEVVRLLVEGRTNQQIAEALVVSRRTVTSHLSSAMRKLRVSSRTALAVSAVELGLAHIDHLSPGE